MKASFIENIDNKEGSVVHPKKMIIWISMISIVMIFAGLTSYLIVRKAEGNWADLTIPSIFVWSTVVIIISSIVQQLGLLLFNRGKENIAKLLVVLTIVLGFAFMYIQQEAWMDLFNQGFAVGGPGSNSSASIIYILVWVHIAHIIIALLYLVSLLFVIILPKYTDSVKRRFESSTIFWHFLGLLWIYLYVFLLLNYN